MKRIFPISLIILAFVLGATLFIQNLDPHYSIEMPYNVINKTNRELKIDFMITDVFKNDDAYFEKHTLTILPRKMDGFLAPDYDSNKEGYLFLYIESDDFSYNIRYMNKVQIIAIYDNPLRAEIEKIKDEYWEYHQ